MTAMIEDALSWQKSRPDYPNCQNISCPCKPKAMTNPHKTPDGGVMTLEQVRADMRSSSGSGGVTIEQFERWESAIDAHLNRSREVSVPDAKPLPTDVNSPTFAMDYNQAYGWNDCRVEMLKRMEGKS